MNVDSILQEIGAMKTKMNKKEKIVKTPEEAIEILEEVKMLDDTLYTYSSAYMEALEVAISALKETQQYREIGTVEELKNSTREEGILKFYYCESEDDYYIGKRVGNFYYARYGKTGFTWFMSRYLPWGEHVIAPNTVWKEHTYPSEPKEIPFFEWLQGFMKKYCGGTAEECREAAEKQKPMKVTDIHIDEYYCPACGVENLCDQGVVGDKYCPMCGQAIYQNLEGMEDDKTGGL